ncbi:MAG: hypothetical protein ACI3T9_04490 [Romboutsia timonensis]
MNEREFERNIYKLKTLKADKKELDKQMKALEGRIKEEFDARGVDRVDYETIGQGLQYTTVDKTSMDEDKLISILRELGAYDCIELKPTVNEDKVQELIYKGIINIEDIAPAMIDKSYKVLKFVKLNNN